MVNTWSAYYDSIHGQLLVIKHYLDEEGWPTDSEVVFMVDGYDLMAYASEEELIEYVKEEYADVLVDLGLES